MAEPTYGGPEMHAYRLGRGEFGSPLVTEFHPRPLPPQASIFNAADTIRGLEATIASLTESLEAARKVARENAQERDEAREAFVLRDRQYRELLAEAKAALS